MNQPEDRPAVLIVDDDEGVCALISDALTQEGIACLTANTGGAALKLLDEHGPLLTLLDLKLPDMDGKQIATMLSSRDPRVPFIVISGLSNTQVAIDLMKQGAVDFLIKDLAFLNLIPGVVKRALDAQSRERKLREAEEALRDSEERFRQIAENIRDVFFVLDSNKNLLYLSPAYESVYGRPREAMINDPEEWKRVIVEEDQERLLRWVEPITAGAGEAQCQYRIRKPDGSIRWLESRAFPVKNRSGEFYRVAGLTTDITERKQLEQEILNISEIERRRIGHDLHDDLCQRLAAIKLKCEMLAHQLKGQSLKEGTLASEISAKIAEATALTRSLARGLSPVDIEAEGLMVALEKLANSAESLYEVPVFFHCPQTVMVSDATCAVHIYRIAQELITNAARHASPTRIDVVLAMDCDYVRLEVINDGKVFSEPPVSNGGMGLRIIRYRANAIGGVMHFKERGDGKGGTRAICLAPQSTCNPEPEIHI